MALSEILKLGSKVAGVASAIPGFAPFAAPISAVLGVAGNMVPQGNNNVNQGAVDVTGQLKGSSMFNANPQNITYPPGTSNPTYTPQSQYNGQPYGMNVPSIMKGYNEMINPLNSGTPNLPNPFTVNPIGDVNSIYTNNIQVPEGYFNSNVDPNNPVAPNNLVAQNNANRLLQVQTSFEKNRPSPPQVNQNVVQNQVQDPNQKWLDMAAAAQGKTDKIVNQANTYNAIGQGITGVGSLLSIINEIGKQPSEMLQPAQYRTANLDSNQSAFINANMEQIKNSKNAQKRLLQDLGVDPMLAGINTENFASDQTLKVLSEAERTRQGILGSQEQINASIQAQANDSLQRTKMFNIQKQLQENQMGGANLSAAITGLAGSVMGFGSGTLANNYWGEITKANTRQSFLQTQ
jgi:hypothetical protein